MSYHTWQDLVEADAAPTLASTSDSDANLHADLALPEDVRALMEERARLEAEFKALVGEAPPDPDAERFRRMYPVPVHTKETRIEERRQRRRLELLRLAVIRAVEKRELARKVAESAEEGRQHALRELREERAAEEQWLLERRSALALRKKRIASKPAPPDPPAKTNDAPRVAVKPKPKVVERVRPRPEPTRKLRAKAIPKKRRERVVARIARPKAATPEPTLERRPPDLAKRPSVPREKSRTSDTRFERRERERPRARIARPKPVIAEPRSERRPLDLAKRRSERSERRASASRPKASRSETRFERRDRERFRS